VTLFIWIDGKERNLRFSAAHWVEGAGKCERLHGHDYYVSVRVYGPVNKDGTVIDFRVLKDAIKRVIEDLDHKVLISEKRVIKEENGLLYITKDTKQIVLPKEDVYLLPLDIITAEELAKYIANRIYEELKEEFRARRIYQIDVCVDEGGGQSAWHIKKLFA